MIWQGLLAAASFCVAFVLFLVSFATLKLALADRVDRGLFALFAGIAFVVGLLPAALGLWILGL